MQVAADGIEYDVDPRLCSDPKPSMVEACNNVPCPSEWVAQPFEQVGVWLISLNFVLRLSVISSKLKQGPNDSKFCYCME